MKLQVLLVVTLLVILNLTAHADESVFGNNPNGDGSGFSLVAYDGQSMSGGAIEFTPTENIDLTSVSLWLSGYTGQFGQNINASIWASNNNTPWAPYISLSSPTHNNGALAEFTFSNPTGNLYSDPSGSLELSAGTAYWLVVTAEGQSGPYESGATWVDGGSPAGGANFDGADDYYVNSGSFDASSTLPSFSINSDTLIQSVPEPGCFALMTIPALLAAGRKFYKARTAGV